jgi:hypothetical protein
VKVAVATPAQLLMGSNSLVLLVMQWSVPPMLTAMANHHFLAKSTSRSPPLLILTRHRMNRASRC